MIWAENLTKRFSGLTAVSGLSLSVSRGELLALLGPNGAGKTTTVRMLSAILQPSGGRASINGHDVVAEAEQVRRSVGLLTEVPGLYRRMNGLEYLIFFGRLYGLDDSVSRQRAMALFERFDIAEAAGRRLGEYSKGMRQKIGIIRAMLHDPAVLILDEPTSALDPRSAKLVRDAIQALRDEQRTIVLCTHNLAEAEILADRTVIIRRGQVITEGTIEALKLQLLGPPRLQVQLDRSVKDSAVALDDLVTVERVHGNIIQYRTDRPHEINPQLVRRLMGLGFGIIALQEIPQSLEELYLQVIADEAGVS